MGDGDGNFSYLDLLASIGYARHIGGKGATDLLIDKAGIDRGSRVLDVGCGLGKTSCRLAAEIGCSVVGVDIMPRMIAASRATARKLGVDGRARFIEGDARRLPFEAETFDAVIVESVTVFVEDVARAIAEYYRVTRPGGVVCDNEVCITRASREQLKDDIADLEAIFTAFSSRTNRGILTFEDWRDLYRGQFSVVDSAHFVADPEAEALAKKSDGFDALASMGKTMWIYYTNPQARAIIDTTRKMYKYVGHFGYGLFVCHR